MYHCLQGQAKRRKSNIYLSDNFAPIAKETQAEDLEVVGKIPSDVEGVYARTGPNPVLVPNGDYHWYVKRTLAYAYWSQV